MSFIEDARKQFFKLWSIRIMLLATILNTIAGCLFVFQQWMSPLMFLVVNVVLNIAAIVARMVAQDQKEPIDGLAS
jgi:hypothetical protein